MRDICIASNHTAFNIYKNHSYYYGAAGVLLTILIKIQNRAVGRSLIFVQKRYNIHQIQDNQLYSGGETARVLSIFT